MNKIVTIFLLKETKKRAILLNNRKIIFYHSEERGSLVSKIRIHQGSKDLYVNIISVNSRYVDFIIHNDLSIDMKVPVGMSKKMIEEYVRLNETMIFQEYEKKQARNHQMLPITLDLEEGRIVYRGGLYLPFLGKTDVLLRIKYLSDFDTEETKIYMEDRPNQEKHLIIKTDNDSQEFLRYCIIRYYKKCALVIVQKKVEEFARKMELQYNQIMITGQKKQSVLRRPRLSYQNLEVKNQLTLWGSCNRKHNLKFDWKLAMLPMEIIEYIIVHELTHLKVMNHSTVFWNEIEKVMPEYKECRTWLEKHGKEYEIF